MVTRVLHKTIAIYALSIGIINLITWTILLISGQVTDFDVSPYGYLFHWISEFSTALLLIVAGIINLKKTACHHNILYTAFGFLLIAIGGAFTYYLRHFDPLMFSFSALITGLTIIAVILLYRHLQDFVQLTIGLSIYALLNIIGDAIDKQNFTVITMATPSILFLIVMLIGVTRKDMFFKYLSTDSSINQTPEAHDNAL